LQSPQAPHRNRSPTNEQTQQPAWTSHLGASRLLSLPLFGLLSYVEPVLLFVASLVLGETLTAIDAISYSLLAIALAVLALGGFNTGVRVR
uniref:hypothetical protein n=1 Tax=Cumulibacter soli TaxID=2546344 RepID=UPI001ABB48BD